MIAQPLRAARAALLLDRLEDVRHVAGIVTSARHDVRPEQVRLLFVGAAEPQERGAQAELRALRDHLPQTATDDCADDRARDGPYFVRGRLVSCAVPCRSAT